MLTNEDIKKIIKAHEEIFYSKTEMDGKFEELRKDFSNLQTSVIAFAVNSKKSEDETVLANHRINNHENWIKKAAPKIGLEFKS